MNRATALLAFLVAAASCGHGASDTARHRGAASPAMPDTALAQPLHLVAARGPVEAKLADGRTSLEAGAVIRDVRGVRAGGRGAVVAIGEAGRARAVLWIRGGSEARLAEDGDGAVFVDAARGEVRMNSLDPELASYARAPTSSARATVAIAGRDVLLRRDAETGELALSFTAAAPSRASWSLDLDDDDDSEPAGIGTLTARTSDRREQLLALRRLSVNVERRGDWATTEVEHVFYNADDARMEGTFRFPLPDGAMLLGLAMEIDGRLMEGELVEKGKARRTYESIVDEMQDPALLEWEEGRWFKLRVFPIEPTSEKRVVLRYAAPLRPAADGWEYVYATAAPEMQAAIDHFQLRFDGETIADERHFTAGDDVVVPYATPGGEPSVWREQRADGTYTAARIAPDWEALGLGSPAGELEARKDRLVVVVFDTSRSALEGRALALDTLDMIFDELRPSDRVAVLAADIEVRAHAPGFAAATHAAAASARRFLEGIEPDGASDLGAALRRAAALARSAETEGSAVSVVYIGDGTATWGVTDADALTVLAREALGDDVPLFATIVGKGASTEQWQAMTATLGGRTDHPRSAAEARRAAFFVANAADVARLEDVTIRAPDGTEVLAGARRALFVGDELDAVMRTPLDADLPAEITVSGRLDGRAVEQTVSLHRARPTSLIAQRWAVRKMAALDEAGADEETLVAMSRDYQVMNRYTSFLVLESEEAYRQWNIERRAREEALARNDAPQVTGGDLESLGAPSPSLSPDHIQPGDPEIRVPAPADARSVVVVFPFGVTKAAAWDEEAGAWIARFLIDKHTADGAYQVLVVITHADGSVERLELPYTVDTVAPEIELEARPRRGGRYLLVARQRVGDDGEADLRRVEVQLPDGDVVTLWKKSDGVFHRAWTPGAQIATAEPLVLRVVATDVALNQSVTEMTVEATR